MSRLDLEQESDASQHPRGRLLLGLEVERPDERLAALLRLVDGALVDVAHVLAVDRDRLDEDDRHQRRQFLEPRLGQHARLHVPARALQVQAVHVGALARRLAHLVLGLLRHVALQAHLVERPLVATSHLYARQPTTSHVTGPVL